MDALGIMLAPQNSAGGADRGGGRTSSLCVLSQDPWGKTPSSLVES